MKQRHDSTFFNTSPALEQFASLIGLGMEDEARSVLQNTSENDRQLLIASKIQFKDCSGKVFNCSSYEYAFWAKDSHMRVMLESFMTSRTKTEMHARCLHISQNGLTYKDELGETKTTTAFDISELTNAIRDYNTSWKDWYLKNNSDAIKKAWLKVGLVLRKAPAHFTQELCNSEQSSFPIPDFKTTQLPRKTKYYNWDTKELQNLFPLQPSKGLGYDFTLYRKGSLKALGAGAGGGKELGWNEAGALVNDLKFYERLDEVRTEELSETLTNLQTSNKTTCTLM